MFFSIWCLVGVVVAIWCVPLICHRMDDSDEAGMVLFLGCTVGVFLWPAILLGMIIQQRYKKLEDND